MPKRRLCGVWQRMRQSGVYIASVGSPSGRCINIVRTRAALGTSREVAHVRTVLLTVRPVVAAHARTQAGPGGRLGFILFRTPREYRLDANRDHPDA
jgi:hypothetical protein